MTADRDESVRREGEKALEVARAYKIYDQSLRARGLVDFGDLIIRPIELFQTHPAVRDGVRLQYQHILVDEYQDMNRASSILLSELVNPGKGPWVVGDVRQSIYRFRGASPTNMSAFPKDFPGAGTTPLGVNYRSFCPIIRAFGAFASDMPVGGIAERLQLEANRGVGTGKVHFDIASTVASESEGIAQTIQSAIREGRRYSDHAILARSHSTLVRLAKHLERLGVPCMYFGDFFERPEIRDLLSILSLVSEQAGVGLFRAAQMRPYSVCPDDVLKVFEWRREQEISMLAAFSRLDEITGLTPAGKSSLQELADDLKGAAYATLPHTCLLQFLFLSGHYIDHFADDSNVEMQQRRLAIYQLLQFVFSFRPSGRGDPKRLLLEHVRRLEILDEEKELRRLPAAARDIDAVVAMTVHASKGLQFPVVHIPSVTSRHFPCNRKDQNQLPQGMLASDPLMSQEAEEESLFFVALSRAEDALHISRAVIYGGGAWSNVKPSPFLSRLGHHLPKSPDSPPNWTNETPTEVVEQFLQPAEKRESWPARAVETYIECPRQFYYSEVLSLEGQGIRSPFLQFQSALHRSMAWLRQASSAEDRRQGISARLSEDWELIGPRGHAFEAIYHTAAERMLSTAIDLMEGVSLPVDFSVQSSNVLVTCRADHVIGDAREVVIRRFKAGKLAATGEKSKLRYAVMLAAARKMYPKATVHFEHVSLISGDRERSKVNPQKLANELKTLEEALEGIGAGRYAPTPSEFSCPRCPYFFICPAQGQAKGSH